MAKKKTFEESLAELEKIAGELESGDLPLEKSIAKYEQGVKAYKACRKFLDDARKRIEILVKDAEGERVEPFDRAPEAEDAPTGEE